ncbi:MAG: hypothetical protein DLM58_11355 [Pseudonocardiales bacterium]|nr:MAG: hypothetical protein DLM58_11355 [Pseudonocardiales bacterium]
MAVLARSVERLSEHFDTLKASDLAVEAARLDEEFYEIEPANGESLNEAADHAAAILATHHPGLTKDAVDALRWCYTYDWR